jgi:transcriptional regulator with XRE-family HTH domain
MKIKTQMLLDYLAENKMSVEEFAAETGMSVEDIQKLLNGEAIEVRPASLFVHYVGADKAQKMIDWEAIGKKNPLANEIDLPDGEDE